MKKMCFILLALTALAGCNKPEARDIPLSDVMEEIKILARLENAQTADLTEQKTAAQYGIDPSAIEEGYVYYSLDSDKADEVIIARAAAQSDVESIEKAISNELNARTEAWKNDEKEAEKIENHIMRTIDDCVLLVIGDEAEAIDKAFCRLNERNNIG